MFLIDPDAILKKYENNAGNYLLILEINYDEFVSLKYHEKIDLIGSQFRILSFTYHPDLKQGQEKKIYQDIFKFIADAKEKLDAAKDESQLDELLSLLSVNALITRLQTIFDSLANPQAMQEILSSFKMKPLPIVKWQQLIDSVVLNSNSSFSGNFMKIREDFIKNLQGSALDLGEIKKNIDKLIESFHAVDQPNILTGLIEQVYLSLGMSQVENNLKTMLIDRPLPWQSYQTLLLKALTENLESNVSIRKHNFLLDLSISIVDFPFDTSFLRDKIKQLNNYYTTALEIINSQIIVPPPPVVTNDQPNAPKTSPSVALFSQQGPQFYSPLSNSNKRTFGQMAAPNVKTELPAISELRNFWILALLSNDVYKRIVPQLPLLFKTNGAGWSSKVKGFIGRKFLIKEAEPFDIKESCEIAPTEGLKGLFNTFNNKTKKLRKNFQPGDLFSTKYDDLASLVYQKLPHLKAVLIKSWEFSLKNKLNDFIKDTNENTEKYGQAIDSNEVDNAISAAMNEFIENNRNIEPCQKEQRTQTSDNNSSSKDTSFSM